MIISKIAVLGFLALALWGCATDQSPIDYPAANSLPYSKICTK